MPAAKAFTEGGYASIAANSTRPSTVSYITTKIQRAKISAKTGTFAFNMALYSSRKSHEDADGEYSCKQSPKRFSSATYGTLAFALHFISGKVQAT
jgi:hypothetical protein